ncbi:hypothetical protein MWU61_02850 [Loktanella sp. F6476L]|uniref:hypothetical protein n=1 Tax=Loktanella sp. F6476L TaxID=2926405 RepID=UPI001FF2B32D|nr:hypothetical protein [Loktanella sp. F6476L]MCK0119463.1 hypothetical protein [Loktanella sp. F6476L]
MDNRTRALNQAVSIDGWISKFDDNGTATVHADIVFRKGTFGENSDDKVRFKVALKRAEIVLRVPHLEPVKVIKRTIARTVTSPTGIITSKDVQKHAGKVGVSGIFGQNPSIDIAASGNIEKSKETTTESKVALKRFLEQHFVTDDDHAGWELKIHPDVDDRYLSGSPWDAVEAPRLNLKHQTGEAPDATNVVIEIRCAREDIEILDLEDKDPAAQALFRKKNNRNANLAAAEQLIKAELFKAGFLDVPDLDEKHSRILIADKIILVDEA